MLVPSQPSVGDVVHYVSHGTPLRGDGSQAFPAACRAAVITEVDRDDPGRVGLVVQNPTGTFFQPLATGGSVHGAPATALGGSWHWPEVVAQ